MTEYAPGDIDVDTPVNPYSLLDAVNRSSDMAHTGWLIFLCVMAYLMIAVAGVTHQDLLLEKSVQLPIFGIEIPQIQFFQFAPILLVLFHLGIISQLVLLARKTLEFDRAVQQLESGVKRTHPLRLELHNFFFVQGIAGSNRSMIMGAFLHGMSWLTLVVIPVLLLLFIQIKFLPYHSVPVTWAHRLALVADIMMMVLIGVFLIRPEASFFKAVLRSVTHYPIGFIVTLMVFVFVALFSFFVATVPGETLDRITQRLRAAAPTETAAAPVDYMIGFAVPSFLARADGSLFGLFHRNLIVQDTDLVANSTVTKGEPTLSLRDRDLRYARLDRSDLHQADLTNANLDGASLDGTDLRDIRLQCADLTTLILTADRAQARCASAKGANFTRAILTRGQLAGADLTGAKFDEATLVRANLAYSIIVGANFSSANLKKADLTGGVQAQGADFLIASMEGADLTGAQLEFAHMASASMQGTLLSHARLQGAVLRDANLEGADLHRGELQGADLTGAQLENADLRWAQIWMTDPPAEKALAGADLSGLSIVPLTKQSRAMLGRRISAIEPVATRELVAERLRPLLKPRRDEKWEQVDARSRWRDLKAEREIPLEDLAYPIALSESLVELACRTKWLDGSVATGVVKRVRGQNFRGRRDLVRNGLRASDCKPGRQLPRKLTKELDSIVAE